MRRYKVAIIEPSMIIAEGLCKILLSSAEADVVGIYPTLRDFAERRAVRDVEVVIVGSQAVRAGESVRGSVAELSGVTIVLLATTVVDEEVLRQADGVINIYDNEAALLRKLRAAVEQGETNPYSDSHDLSERERDVLILVAKGMANKEIADRLNISIHTVMSHRKNITHKTGIKSVAGLTVYALLNNLLDQNDVTL
ncbi:MAG: response regulator transcription factor [Rikenellaceae bacterium]|nr:response regulator transcription factor [Rikenellaceae bacterium]MBO7343217.1 response regulator transcription factor [Alistipes sp.]